MQNVQPAYQPKTVNTDGWKATRLAWLALFPCILIIRCFLHGWLSIRERCKKDKHDKEAGDKAGYYGAEHFGIRPSTTSRSHSSSSGQATAQVPKSAMY